MMQKNLCLAYDDKMECVPFARWTNSNQSKKNIMNAIGMESVSDEQERGMKVYESVEDVLSLQEFFVIVEENIPMALKSDFIRLRNGINIPKPRREKIYKAVRAILAERGLDEPEAW